MTSARHVAIIMDGNGRWAKRRLLPRSVGHKRGVEAVRGLLRSLDDTGIEVLTLYAFSSENWKRSEDEVSDLMGLLRIFIARDLDEIVERGLKLKIIGDFSIFPADLVTMIQDAQARSASGTQGTLVVALNYGSQQEIAKAAAAAAAKGEVTVETIAAGLETADLPPLDLLIRTSGEVRLSNFLLWQASYAELYFTDVLWPDFTVDHLKQALAEFSGRERRFGGR
ncbi:MAG: di-trans,poly-cis-decaprenylcistransferase [Novosphingobium sp.]|nr:di-trans,poly-cis-decaprenylcistransferase [Novosphingobium sp.]